MLFNENERGRFNELKVRKKNIRGEIGIERERKQRRG